MNSAIVWAGAVVVAAVVSACASGPHTNASMLSGSHMMPGAKAGLVGDRVMPSRSADCTVTALANMPPEHRQICEKTLAKPNNL